MYSKFFDGGTMYGNLRMRWLLMTLTLLLMVFWRSGVAAAPPQAIVFTSTQNNVSSIYSIHPDGTHLYRVIRNGTDPSFTSDGQRIIFVRGRDIFSVDRNGRQLKQITHHKPGIIVSNPVMSQDRTIILFNSTSKKPGSAAFIRLVRSDGTGERTITSGIDPSFSQDQVSVILARGGGIYSMSRSTTGGPAYTPALVHKVGDNVIVRYPRAGRGSFNGIVFAVKPMTARPTWSIRALLFGQETPRVTTLATNASQPAFSQDGRRIVFIRNGDLYIMNSDGTGQKRILAGSGIAAHPRWWMPET